MLHQTLKTECLNLSTTDILDWKFIGCWELDVFGSIPGFYPLYVRSTHPSSCDTKNASRHSRKCALGENHPGLRISVLKEGKRQIPALTLEENCIEKRYGILYFYLHDSWTLPALAKVSSSVSHYMLCAEHCTSYTYIIYPKNLGKWGRRINLALSKMTLLP